MIQLLPTFGRLTGLASFTWWTSAMRYNPLVSLPEFVAGMALGLLFARYGSDVLPRLRDVSARTIDILVAGLVLILAALLVILYKSGLRTTILDAAAPFALPFFSAIILLLAVQRGTLARLLSLPVIVWLGEISYGIYILHVPLWDLLHRISALVLDIAPSNILLVPGYAVLLLLVSGLSFRYLERPIRRAIRARWGQPKRASVSKDAALAEVGAHR
jgi:peptidoglycan/LPS O-acetylase OafA/YrhL